MSINNPIMTVEEVSQKYNVHKNTVYKMLKDGRLRAGGTGSKYRLSRAECDLVFLGVADTRAQSIDAAD